jgi:hypothetical protein
MTQLTIDLEPEDFEPMERREEHKHYLGPVYPFMGKADAALDVAHSLSERASLFNVVHGQG